MGGMLSIPKSRYFAIGFCYAGAIRKATVFEERLFYERKHYVEGIHAGMAYIKGDMPRSARALFNKSRKPSP